MRIWTLHPRYLDTRGLVALWREGLLAQAVLRGQTIGYRNHPQLSRFRGESSLKAIADYLRVVYAESVSRRYRFNQRKINRARDSNLIDVPKGQLHYEWDHLMEKLDRRDPEWGARWKHLRDPEPHPLFRIIPGGIADWERPVTRI